MRTINEVFEDADFDRLEKAKGDKTWREFILTLAPSKEVENSEITTAKAKKF